MPHLFLPHAKIKKKEKKKRKTPTKKTNVVPAYRLGLTLYVSVNVFGKIIYTLGKCKLPIT